MNQPRAADWTLLEELSARQDEVLSELDVLNGRIEAVLQECLAWRSPMERGLLRTAAASST